MSDTINNTNITHQQPVDLQGTSNAKDYIKQLAELSDKFDTYLNSYSLQANFGEDSSKINIVLDEYEKSVFLTRAEYEVFTNLYNGKNIYGDFFEGTEELRRYLDSLVREKTYQSSEAVINTNLTPNGSYIFKLPDDLAFITLEQIKYGGNNSCNNGYSAKVYPVTQDEWANVKDNPFRGPTKYKALRLDNGDNKVEIIVAKDFVLDTYYIKYLKKPNPIILTDLTSSDLTIEGVSTPTITDMSPLLYDTILNRAVVLAIQSKSLGMPNKNNNNE